MTTPITANNMEVWANAFSNRNMAASFSQNTAGCSDRNSVYGSPRTPLLLKQGLKNVAHFLVLLYQRHGNLLLLREFGKEVVLVPVLADDEVLHLWGDQIDQFGGYISPPVLAALPCSRQGAESSQPLTQEVVMSTPASPAQALMDCSLDVFDQRPPSVFSSMRIGVQMTPFVKTPQALAAHLGMSRRNVYRLAKSGSIHSIKSGRRLIALFPASIQFTKYRQGRNEDVMRVHACWIRKRESGE